MMVSSPLPGAGHDAYYWGCLDLIIHKWQHLCLLESPCSLGETKSENYRVGRPGLRCHTGYLGSPEDEEKFPFNFGPNPGKWGTCQSSLAKVSYSSLEAGLICPVHIWMFSHLDADMLPHPRPHFYPQVPCSLHHCLTLTTH